MKKSKSLMSAALAAAMIISVGALAGCEKKDDEYSVWYSSEIIDTETGSKVSSGTKSDKSQSSSGKSSTSKVAKDTDDEKNSAVYDGIEKLKGTTVRFATWEDHSTTEAASAIAAFSKKYGIKYEMVNIGQYEYTTKLSGLIASGQSPDIIMENGNFPALFPMAQRLDKISSVNVSDAFWDKNTTEICSIDGVPYFVNSADSPYIGTALVVYNKKLFEDNGFKTPQDFADENKWTIDAFRECATRISKLGSGYIGASVRAEFAVALFGTEFVTYKNSKFVNNISSGQLNTALNWYMTGVDSKIFTPTMSTNEFNSFVSGKVGMILWTDYLVKKCGPIRNIDPSILAAVPAPKVNASDAKYPNFTGIRAYGICKGAKNAVGAGYFLRYFLDFKNYDYNDIYLNNDVIKTVKNCKKISSSPQLMHAEGVLNISEGLNTQEKYYSVITSSTAAQVSVNLQSLKNKVDDCVNKANKVINEKRKEQ